jgi:hypothetical protein
MRFGRLLRVLAMAAIAAALPTPPAAAGEYYYVLIFGSESSPKRLRFTHTWATFVRAVGEGPDLSTYAIEQNTVSWLPQSLNVRVWAARPEPGVNLDLYQTLNAVYAERESVTLWGPFVATPDIYQRSLRVRQILDGGEARYRAISTPRDLLISDCIHAVAAVDPIFGRGHYPLVRIGKPASRFLAREVTIRGYENRGIDQAAYDNAWLIPRLGLDRYPIEVVPPSRIPRTPCTLCRVPE